MAAKFQHVQAIPSARAGLASRPLAPRLHSAAMPPKKYPLDPLVRLRQDKVDASTRELAASIQAREGAERARLAAEAERARLAEEARQARAKEERALGRGELSVADLQRQGAWEARTQWEDQARATEVAAATERETAAREGEGRARSRVSTAEAEAKVVTEHRGRWVAEGQRAADATAEEEAADAWRPRQ
jgi:hypothetical protein